MSGAASWARGERGALSRGRTPKNGRFSSVFGPALGGPKGRRTAAVRTKRHSYRALRTPGPAQRASDLIFVALAGRIGRHKGATRSYLLDTRKSARSARSARLSEV